MTKNEELKLRLESNDIQAMYEIVINILGKYSNNLYLADNFESIFSPFILCRYLSMRSSLIPYAEYLSTVYSTSKLSNVNFYKLAYSLIPKQSNLFIKYIKKIEKNKKKNEEIINNKNEINSNLMDL